MTSQPVHPTRLERLLGHARLAGPLAIVYLSLTGSVAPANLVTAILISSVAAALVRPPAWPIRATSVPLACLKALRYTALLLIDIAKCGWDVTLRILSPKPRISSGILAIPSQSNSPAVTAFSAHGITVTPGEMVVAIDDKGTLYTHCLDLPASAANATAAQTTRKQRLESFITPSNPS